MVNHLGNTLGWVSPPLRRVLLATVAASCCLTGAAFFSNGDLSASKFAPPQLLAALGAVLPAQAQTAGQSITLDADVQEANAQTGVITARGNVRLNYPGRQIQATAQQAQYFSEERRMVLTGNVLVTQAGSNTIRGEVVTYLVDESRFVALPKQSQQVRSVYVIQDRPTQP